MRPPDTPAVRAFAQRNRDTFGAAAEAWLAALPELLDAWAARWSLTLGPPVADLSYNYVAPAILADGTSVMLKAGVPGDERRQEIEALRCFGGEGMVRLLEADEQAGVALLERLEPGTPVAALADDDARTEAVAEVLRQLWRPAPASHGFTSVSHWFRGFDRLRERYDGGSGPLPAWLVERAEVSAAKLIDPAAETTLIHGDPNDGNIVAAERAPWLAIDPKGVVGDPYWDLAWFTASLPPVGRREQDRLMARRAERLAALLGFDATRILEWVVPVMVLSGWWSAEDHGAGWEDAFARAELAARRLGE